MYFNLKKKKTSTRFLSALLFLSVFVTSIMIQTMQVKAYWMDDYEIKNKTYFVKIGDKVYFRKFGKNALPRDMQLHDYLEYPTGEKGSFIATYDTKTKKVSKAFDDNGSFFVYMNKRFYMEHNRTVYSVDKNGKRYRKLTDCGLIEGGFDKKYLIVNKLIDDGKVFRSDKSIVYKNGEKIAEFKINNQGYENSLVTDGHYVVYLTRGGIWEKTKVWCKDLKSNKAPVLMGTTDNGEELKFSDFFSLLQMKRKKSNIYVLMALYEGAPGWPYGRVILRANSEKKNSLKIHTKLFNNDEAERFELDKKWKIKTIFHKNYAYINGDKLYFIGANGKKKLLTNDLAKFLDSAEKDKGKEEIEYHISTEKYIDGNLFMLINRQIRNVEKEVGWRPVYDILERYYVRIPVKNPNGIQILYKDVFN